MAQIGRLSKLVLPKWPLWCRNHLFVVWIEGTSLWLIWRRCLSRNRILTPAVFWVSDQFKTRTKNNWMNFIMLSLMKSGRYCVFSFAILCFKSDFALCVFEFMVFCICTHVCFEPNFVSFIKKFSSHFRNLQCMRVHSYYFTLSKVIWTLPWNAIANFD